MNHRIYLLGEEHSLNGKNIWHLAKLIQIEQEFPPLHAITLELDEKCYQPALDHYHMPDRKNHISTFAQRRSIPLFAVDQKPLMAHHYEQELGSLVKNSYSDLAFEEYRQLHWANLRQRDYTMADAIDRIFRDAGPGSLAHIGGLTHVRRLTSLLTARGYDLVVKNIRHSKTSKPRIAISDDPIFESMNDYLACFVDSSGNPVGKASGLLWEKFRPTYCSDPGKRLIFIDDTGPPLMIISSSPETFSDKRILGQLASEIKNDFEKNHIVSAALAMPEYCSDDFCHLFLDQLAGKTTDIDIHKQ